MSARRIEFIAASNGIHVVCIGQQRGDFKLIAVWPARVKLSFGGRS